MTKQYKQLEEAIEQEKKLFKLYRNFEVVGKEMKDDLLLSSYTLRKDKDKYLFNMADGNSKNGLLNQAYGVFVLSLLMDKYNVQFTDSEKRKYKNSLIALIDHVESKGLDASPYANDEINYRLFGNGDYAFIESVTWVLSCLLFARRLHVSKKIVLKNEMDKVISLTAKLLKILLDSVIRADGTVGYEAEEENERSDYVGWGPVTGCEEPSLYFTHSVCETFGDMEDTVIGNTDIGIGEDTDFVEQIKNVYKANIVEQFRNLCAIVGKNVYEKYADKIGSEFFYANGSTATMEQISCSMQSPVLLNQLYTVLCAIYTNYHKTLENDIDKWKKFSVDIKNAVDMVYKAYRDLQYMGKESLVNREYVTFSEKHKNKDFCTFLARERINVSVLEALIIRTKCMIVTYVTKYPEREISEILSVILNERSVDSKGNILWLWNQLNYDLQHTERSYSAIREFYDYYESYERDYAEKKSKIENLRRNYKARSEAMKKSYQAQLREERKASDDKIKEFEKDRDEQIEKAKNANLVEAAVRAVVADSMKGELVKVLTSAFNSIANDNAENRADNENRALTSDENKLRSSIVALVKSFLYPLAQKAIEQVSDKVEDDRKAKDWSSSTLTDAFSFDLRKLFITWMYSLSRGNTPKEGFTESDLVSSITDKLDI